MAQDPRGRIGLRFVLGILCPQTILLLRPCAGMPKPLDLEGQFKSMLWHSRGCEKFDAIQRHDDFSHPLFRFYSPRSLGAAVGPASRRSGGRQPAFAMSLCRSPSLVLRFPGVQGWITSEPPWQRVSPPVLRRRVGPAVQRTHISALSRREHRTHAAYRRSRVRRPCVRGRCARAISRTAGQYRPTPHLC